MNEIIKKIEAEQLKAEVPEFHVGDTVKVYAKRWSKRNFHSKKVLQWCWC